MASFVKQMDLFLLKRINNVIFVAKEGLRLSGGLL